MKTDIKERWVEALRSGDYSQGIGKLAGSITGDPENPGRPSFCCLGVLCDLAVKDGIIPEPIPERRTTVGGDPMPGYYMKFDGEGGFLPESVVKWAEVNSCNPQLTPKGHYPRPAAGWNDDGHSFTEIADMIEVSL